MVDSLLLIAGIPTSGKSYFGNWLGEHHAFLYYDVEKHPLIQGLSVVSHLQKCYETKVVSPFVNILRDYHQPIVLDWGFPPEYLPIVAALKDEGFSIWWFDADHESAEKAYKQRGTGENGLFNNQMQAIDHDWPKIQAIFTPNIVLTLDTQGKRLSVEEIFHRIFEKAG